MANLGDPNYKQDHLARIYPPLVSNLPVLNYRHSIRRHKIFVRREIFTHMNPNQVIPQHLQLDNRTWQISAAHIPDLKDITVQPLSPQSIRRWWNNSDVDYYCQELIAEYNKGKGSPPPYLPFKVIVPSLCHIGSWSKNLSSVTPDEIKRFMKRKARQQVGCHLFVKRRGDISVLGTYVITQQEIYDTRKVAMISSIYPVIRYPWRPPNGQNEMQTVLGLHYKRFTYYDEGDRYYHRLSDKCLQAGGVYELTPNKVNSLTANPPYLPTIDHGQQQPYFGLFVCAGAKLVVIDGCQGGGGPNNLQDHNRSFIQQGGLVLVDGTLRLAEPKFDNILQIHGNFPHYDWNTFVNGLVSVRYGSLSNTHDQNAINIRTHLHNNYNNPILFLGANDSQFNSIAWHLSVNTSTPPNQYNRTGILDIPQGANIVAIANGRDGLEEVLDRIYYENLHDSVVTEHTFNFRAWGAVVNATQDQKEERVERILNLGELRSFEYNFQNITHFPQRLQPRKPIFREFNIMVPDDYQQTIDFYLTSQSPPPVPPMYPPLYGTDMALYGTVGLRYLPNDDLKEMLEYMCDRDYPGLLQQDEGLYPACYHWKYNQYDDPYTYEYKFDGHPYELTQNRRLYAYHWERMGINENMTNFDGYNKRLGVDGWVWKKIGTQTIGEFSQAVVFCEKNDYNAMDPNQAYPW